MGKKYNENGNLKFEGEFLNEKKWNGKGFNKDGNMIFIIENGKGYIKETNEDGEIEFEGEYLNGERNGKGKLYYGNGNLKFEGEFLNEKNGMAKDLIKMEI